MWRCIDATGALKHASNYTSTAFHNGDVRNEAGQGRRVRQAAVVRHIAGIERSRNLGLLRTFLSRRRAEEPGRQRPPEHSQFHAEWVGRSEEHTSELQSLMRISYAVFCLKKKNQKRTSTIWQTIHHQWTDT